MSSNNPGATSAVSKAESSPLRAETERLISKERFKDAVKQAKLCYKEETTPESHELLERAYFLRARQLQQLGMASSAAEVAQHLLDFGVTTSEFADELVRLLMSIGLVSRAQEIHQRLGSQEQTSKLATIAADLAVVRPERAREVTAEVARDARLVRDALERLQGGDEGPAMEVLRGLARSSPLSEWKFFARGLAALYRGDQAETRANWDRLDTERKAHAIAARLAPLERVAESAAEIAPDTIAAFETLAWGEPVIGRLRQLSTHLAAQNWSEAIRLVGPVSRCLRRIDPRLADRLTRVMLGSLLDAAGDRGRWAAPRLVREFTRSVQPLAIDPSWNRLWAIVWDDEDDNLQKVEGYWKAYCDDLERSTVLSAAEKVLAQSLVWSRVAALYRDRADDAAEDSDIDILRAFGIPAHRRPGPGRVDPDVVRTRKDAVGCLEKSIALAPAILSHHQTLVDMYVDWKDDAGLERAARRLLEHFPDDAATLERMARHHFAKNDPAAALSFVARARAAKPLDESLRELEWFVRISLARQHAIAKRWDEGRAEFAAAELIRPDEAMEYSTLAKRVIFELKAKRPDLSDQFLKTAQEKLVEPTPLWLALVIESIRYQMPKTTQSNYAKVWRADLKKKCRSETAGAMASLLYAYLSANIEYAGRSTHVGKLIAYLGRTTQLKYRRNDIESVCRFLSAADRNTPLLAKLLARGLKLYPESASLTFQSALIAFGETRFGYDPIVGIAKLERALKLAEASTDREDKSLIPVVQSAVSMLRGLCGHPMGLPGFNGGPFGFGSPDDWDEDDDDWFDDDDDDDDDDGGWWAPAPPKPSGSARTKRKSSKRS